MNDCIVFQEGHVVLLGNQLHHGFPQTPSCHWSSVLERLNFKFNICSGKKEKAEKMELIKYVIWKFSVWMFIFDRDSIKSDNNF